MAPEIGARHKSHAPPPGAHVVPYRNNDQQRKVPRLPPKPSLICNRQLPFAVVLAKVARLPSGRNTPTYGGAPAVIDPGAASSNVVRPASGVQFVPKFAPGPLPELKSTMIPSGEMSEILR